MDRSAAPWRVLDAESATERGGEAAAGPQPPARGRAPLLAGLAFAVAALLAALAFAVAAAGAGGTVEVDGDQPFGSGSGPARVDGSAAPSAGILVDVQGAVAHPGVVRLVAGSRVGDAIAAAGGYGPRVDADRVGQVLNLAASLHDGDQVVVPSRDDPAGRGGSGGSSSTGNGPSSGTSGTSPRPVDLNRATIAELDALPGIGPVTAAKIIAARDEKPFASIDDLRTRKLVGPATFEKIKALVTVG